ncbi:hypothetical protein BDN72DRAFT_954920 [Pluteus cervinus]|uniref:Uncharacterized protein n=1 Tax=Pluteus cervinus TaxID=181527 RepID=A0ACD3BCB9_9AGAR|nr:hypothetical protein BDN72DRAFT_954920 [Pluteus cervinus]
MATWATPTPLNHPWFMPPTSKRKEAPNVVEREPSPPPKRPRLHALEHHLAHLSLNHSPVQPLTPHSFSNVDFPYDPSQFHQTYARASYPMISEMLPSEEMEILPPEDVITLPQSIESPTVPEVKMRSSSWYEPEPDRIVVTDLDGSSDDETDAGHSTPPPVNISAALLDRIRPRPFDARTPMIPSTPTQSQALVLFRPLSRPIAVESESIGAWRSETKVDPRDEEDHRMDIDQQK